MKENKFLSFVASTAGRYVMTVVFALIVWGMLMGLIATRTDEGSIIFFLICGIFGWKALTRIQPSMFLWLNLTGWIIYFMVKGILSCLIGVFVAPFQMGKYVADHVNAAVRNS